jgi:hypothetical protein
MGEEQRHIISMDHSQVAMHGPRRVQVIGAGTGAVQGTSDFLPDIATFPHADDRDAPVASEYAVGEGVELFIEPFRDFQQSRGLGGENTASDAQAGRNRGWHTDLVRGMLRRYPEAWRSRKFA